MSPSSASAPTQPALALLSLSDAAASARHMPVQPSAAAAIPITQRRRSSFSQTRKRRPSDARDLLVSHPDDRDRAASSRLQMSTSLSLSPPQTQLLSKSVPLSLDAANMKEDAQGGHSRKKGTTFRCESCSKVYRHPSCLVKHRWEHSPHWREASKFLLSKHQQVQLLEAAAILSHLSPVSSGGGTSLPEDRSLWPSYLSGGLLPLPTGAESLHSPSKPRSPALIDGRTADLPTDMSTSDDDDQPDLPPTLTQFRPGLLGHPNPPLNHTPVSQTQPVPVPGWDANRSTRYSPVPSLSLSAFGSGSVPGSPHSSSAFGSGSGWANTPYTSTSGPFSVVSGSEGGWRLPRSSVRGGEGESDEEDGEVLGGDREVSMGVENRDGNERVEKEEEEWDGMEMEMDL